MKQILKLGKGRYVHLDSYLPKHQAFVGNALVAITAALIASATVGAMLGYDTTQFNHGSTNRVPFLHSP